MAKPKDITYKVTKNNCWECTSHALHLKTKGYFIISVKGKKMFLHRFMYEETFGPIKEGNLIRHTCDNTLCINPDHLIEGNHADNAKDMVDRNRHVGPKGTEHPNSRLNEKQVIEIFNSDINSYSELGRKYNINYNTVRQIKLGITWKHITKTL